MDSNEINANLKAEKPKAFVTTLDKYSKAIAQSILEQTKLEKNFDLNRINFEDASRKVIEFRGGSYALIYKNGLPVRIAPFVWSLDQQTRRTWAVFRFNNFYGHKNSLVPWRRISEPVVLTPFTQDSKMVDSFGKGYLAKFDEGMQFQVPIAMQYDKESWADLMDSKQHISAALTLWMDLLQYTKNKLNMKLIMIVVGIVILIVVIYFFWPTLSHIIGGLGL